MRQQYEEEILHVTKMYDYILDQGGQIHLKQIDEPGQEFGTPVEIFEDTLKHEQFVTGSINELMGLAVDERDYATQTFLQWYVTEQVEEEANVGDILAPLKMVGDGAVVEFLNVPVGRFPIQCTQVRAATTAGSIVAVW